MNAIIHNITFSKTLIATAVASVLLASCATAPVQPAGSAEVRSRLTQLQADPNLGSRAPLAIKEADAAVLAAEQPQADASLAQHRVFMADRKVETARAQAETRFAEDERVALGEQRESARLDSRTREADAARTQVAAARADSVVQKLAADDARGAANAAQVAATNSQYQATELQRQIDELNARPTDRGLVVTLGDVLFTSGQADLKTGATGNLNKLVAFLNEYPNRTVMIEGYTDSVGSEDYNQGLSQRRADSVKAYLVGQGIGSVRLVAAGKGENAPVAGNDSAAGRQQNRRVEVIINTPPAAALR
ncbi:MAG TPA: OmpA family protein [Steroidobacteraceae bacterium]|nr:OmpA family protein [Steroidobacteraceae bacterium]